METRLVEHFRENGWVVVPDVLSPTEVLRYRAALDADRASRPEDWQLSHTHSRGVGPELLSRTKVFDRLASLRDSPVRSLVERLFEPHAPHLCGLSFFVRDSNPTIAGGDPSDPACVTRVWVRLCSSDPVRHAPLNTAKLQLTPSTLPPSHAARLPSRATDMGQYSARRACGWLPTQTVEAHPSQLLS